MSATHASLDYLVHQALAQSPFLTTTRQLRFETQEGKVVLQGVVNSYYQKQMAQETLRRVKGVNQIDNRLEVCWT